MNYGLKAIRLAWFWLLTLPLTALSAQPLEWIRPSAGGDGFVRGERAEPFRAWGFNYDHDESGRLLEDYWESEWGTVVEDFSEMKALDANVVRIHLQLGSFMDAPGQPNTKALAQLKRLIRLAEETGLYLNLTGLGCYHKKEVPAWYHKLGETDRWKTQAHFWAAIAKVGADSPAIFCYDLMNEPILPGKKKATDWLAGEFGGKHFVQRIALDLTGRTRQQVAKAWVDKLVAAIRRAGPTPHDHRRRHPMGAHVSRGQAVVLFAGGRGESRLCQRPFLSKDRRGRQGAQGAGRVRRG